MVISFFTSDISQNTIRNSNQNFDMKGTGIEHREDTSENIITIKIFGKLVNKHNWKAKTRGKL